MGLVPISPKQDPLNGNSPEFGFGKHNLSPYLFQEFGQKMILGTQFYEFKPSRGKS